METEQRFAAKPTPITKPPDAARAERPVIDAECGLFACRVCRTKTGWRHQVWCSCGALALPGCEDCVYRDVKMQRCEHPAVKRRRGGISGSLCPIERTEDGKAVVNR